jgi:anti-sigma factor RsiW
MTGHLTTTQLENYSRQKLAASELLHISDHLSTCEACRHQLETVLAADATFFAIQAQVFSEAEEIASQALVPAHPTMETTANYVDGTLSKEETQIVTDHLSRCEQCALAVHDLDTFKKQVGPALHREYEPAIAPAATRDSRHRVPASVLFPFSRFPALAFGSALAVLFLLGAGLLFWRAHQEDSRKEARTPVVVAPASSSTPAGLIAELNDGGRRLALDQNGNLSGAEDLQSEYQVMLREALMRQPQAKPELLAGLTRPPSSLMGGNSKQANEFSVVDPVGKVVITDRPAFRWSSLDGATAYAIEVYDEKFNPVAASAQLSSTSWTPPKPLQRGATYSWQVKAIKDGQQLTVPRPPAPQAKFRILDQERTNELAQAQRAYTPSHFMLGLLYLRSGLLDEAEREFRASQEANVNSPIVLQMLQNAQAMRH